jgi:GT2 family glycosyltransferase
MKKELSFLIIIANYNGEKYLNNCLNSLSKTKYENFKICIVDDGSTDKSISIIESYFKTLDIDLLLQDHGGASKARNKAILKYQNLYDILIFLDNDTEVDSLWLNELNNSFLKNSNAGALQCLLIDYENRNKIQSNGIYLIPHVCWGVSIQSGENLISVDKNSTPCAAISAALAVRSEAIKITGVFDEKLAVSTEDLDFTWRLWIGGFKVLNCPESKVFHYSKSMDARKEMNVNLYTQYFHLTKNSIRSLLKNYSLKYLVWYLPQCILINFVRSLLVLIKRKDPSSLKAFISALFWNFSNLRDTLKQRYIIQRKRKITDGVIYNTVMIKEPLEKIYEKYFKQTSLL